jgi:uncharacterized RDD family membrane protein YckC
MNQITVLNKSNVPTGPFTRAQVAEKLQSGEIALTDLAFVEGIGFAEWTPLRDVLARIDGPAVAPPPAPISVQPPGVPGYSYAATMAPPSHLAYAGFWIRFVAYLIDGLIISIVVFIAAFVISMVFMVIGSALGTGFKNYSGSDSNNTNPAAVVMMGLMELAIWATVIGASWLYFAKMESGPGQATIGKRAMGLQVTDIAGQRIGFGRASGRFFGKIVSAMTFYIGFIMAAFTERKQALHDMIAGTLVVKQ